MGFFIFQKYDTDVTFDKVMGQCHLSLTVAANVGEVLFRRKTAKLKLNTVELDFKRTFYQSTFVS